MMLALRIFLFILIVGGALLVFAGQAGLLKGKPRGELGVKDGKLQRPSKTENSVSSQAELWPDHPMLAYAGIAPIAYTGSAEAASNKLQSILRTTPRTEIVKAEGSYIYAQCTTALLRFVDDVEFAIDDNAKVIHVRSASRLGRKDFGVNRKRVEAIRAQFVAG
jgi:uncharacterized protein (DUF1499 family)